MAVANCGSLLFLSNMTEHHAAPRWSTRLKSTAVIPDVQLSRSGKAESSGMLRPGATTLSRTVAVTAPELQPSRSGHAEGRDQPPPGLCIMAKSRTVAVAICGSLLFLSNTAEHHAALRWSMRRLKSIVRR